MDCIQPTGKQEEEKTKQIELEIRLNKVAFAFRPFIKFCN